MRLVTPVVAVAVIALGLSMDDGSRMAVLPTLLWAAPVVMIVLAFAGFIVCATVGMLLGAAVGWAWGGADFTEEGADIAGVGGAFGGLVAGLALALYYTAW